MKGLSVASKIFQAIAKGIELGLAADAPWLHALSSVFAAPKGPVPLNVVYENMLIQQAWAVATWAAILDRYYAMDESMSDQDIESVRKWLEGGDRGGATVATNVDAFLDMDENMSDKAMAGVLGTLMAASVAARPWPPTSMRF